MVLILDASEPNPEVCLLVCRKHLRYLYLQQSVVGRPVTKAQTLKVVKAPSLKTDAIPQINGFSFGIVVYAFTFFYSWTTRFHGKENKTNSIQYAMMEPGLSSLARQKLYVGRYRD